MGHVPSPPVTSDAPDVAVTVVLHLRNGLDHVGECIMALVDHTNDVAFQTLIVDHATTDATAGIIASLSGDLAVIRANPVEGYAPPTDRAVTMARAPVLVFLDPDTVVGPGWLGPLLARLGADASLAALQPRVVTADARVWSTGGVRAADGRPLLRDHGRPAGTPGADRVDETIDFLDGSCLVVRRSAFLAAGGYDRAYPPGICQHADLSLALTGLGHRIDYEPTVTVTALARPDLRSGRRRLAAKWPVTPPARRVRSVAFYLPQFHPIEENDLWWGRGFTEWTNVTRVGPRFEGHDQPHLPADLGFCDLRLPETRAAQADLARRHGVDAFCYYHYWFEGRRLLQRPFEEVLASGEPDFPFCLCWANEDWRRNWDGRSGETLVAQHYSEADDRAHIAWLLPVFADPRYLRVDGKPLFLVYRASQLPDPPRTLALWREAARAGGLGELLLCRVESFSADHADPRPLGFDASVEFQPDWDVLETRPRRMDSPGLHYDYDDVVSAMEVKPRPSWRRIPCVMPSWDNTPRNPDAPLLLARSTPDRYRTWLELVAARERQSDVADPVAFVNSWNEWGEGAHLEPSRRWGRTFLEAHADGLRAARDTKPSSLTLCIAGMVHSGVNLAATWLERSGLHVHPSRTDCDGRTSAPGTGEGPDFVVVNDLAVARTWPAAGGWKVTDDTIAGFDPLTLATATELAERQERSWGQWAWADPRSTLLLDAWLEVFDAMRSLLVWRCCADVVCDLSGAPASTPHLGGGVDAEMAARIWLTYNRRIVTHRRLYGDDTVLVGLEALVTRPEAVRLTLTENLGVTVGPSPAADPLGPEAALRRPTAARDAGVDLGPLSDEIADLESELSDLSAC